MNIALGINTGFAINRFPEPDDWIDVVADELGLDTVQFTADLLNPFLPEALVARDTDRIRARCDDKGIRIQTTFTSAFTRVNHVLHPDPDIRRVWIEWFKGFIDVSRRLGAEGVGSHFGILSVRDNRDPARRERRLAEGVGAWRELAEYGAGQGLEYLLFEPMSIPREVAETIPATRDILERCGEGFAIPMRLCLDVDHGDLRSRDPDDTDPHAWIRAFGPVTPCIHIKQSLKDKGGHYPFTAEYNARGTIVPGEILATMRAAGIERCTLLLEISHRERWPAEESVVSDLKESVAYWRPAVDAANAAG
ncbi:MAG: TIM barrel protein [Candidatus Hydrogenedentes bacterium]|nr:TIM barrel protein [Candidatus Hydrogenedentota bacterium]